MITRASFTAPEWDTLQFGAFWVASAVAGADGVVDQGEHGSFSEEIGQAAQLSVHRSTLWGEVVVSISGEAEAISSRYSDDPREIEEGLGDLADLLDEKKLSSDEAEEFKRSLWGLGVRVATSSGGDAEAARQAQKNMRSAGMPKQIAAAAAASFGNISEHEKLALDRVQAALRLSQPVVV